MPATHDQTNVEIDDSFEYWHQVTCRNYSISETKRDSNDIFQAQISSRGFSALTLTKASSDMGAAQLIRGPAEIRRDSRDHFMLFLVTSGEIGIVQSGREAQAQTGDLFLYDQSMPLTLEFQRQYSTIMLNIPRPLLESRIPHVRAFTARRVASDSKLGALAGTIVRHLVEFDEETNIDTIDRIAASTLDIVATALDKQTASKVPMHGRRHRLLDQVETHLLANLQDPQLDIKTIARALNTTPRTLNRVFAAEGTTPMRWLWQQRLGGSYRALAEGRIKNVTEAALRFGFSDASHFSRAFKSAFGKSPQALKRR